MKLVNPEVQRLLRQESAHPRGRGEQAHLDWDADCSRESLPTHLRDVLVTAHDVSPEWHLRIQAAFQENTELGVAKTINLPNSARPEDIQAAFVRAHALGCKGITCYRDGSRDKAFLTIASAPEPAPANYQ